MLDAGLFDGVLNGNFMSALHELLSNLAVVVIATSFWTFSRRHIPSNLRSFDSIFFGSIMAGGCLAAMIIPFQFMPGVFLDARYTFLAVSGLFGGPAAAGLTFAVAIVRRIAIGGTGLTVAIPNIIAASCVGLLGHRRALKKDLNIKSLSLISVLVALSGTLGFYVVLPIDKWIGMTTATTIPFASVLFGATLLSAFAIVQERKRHETASQNTMYRAIIEALPDALNAKDSLGRFVAANPATADIMGADSVDALINKTDFDFYAVDTAREFRVVEEDVMRARYPTTVEQKFVRPDGREAWLSTLKAPLFDEQGNLLGVITHNREITERKRLERALEEAQGRLSDAVANMADGLAMFDTVGIQVFHNQRYADMFPLTAADRQDGIKLSDIVRASLQRGEEASAKAGLEDVIERTTNALLQHGDRTYRLTDGRWIEARSRRAKDGVMVVFTDVTVHRQRETELQELSERLIVLANTDGLTSLLNRRAFDREMEEAVVAAQQHRRPLSLLMLDVDRFKAFNDTYGHPQGDECLKQVAAAVAKVVEPIRGNIVARYGGEEIAIILPGLNHDEACSVASLVASAVRLLEISHIGSEKGIVTVSVGVSTSKSHNGGGRFDLLRDADEGLYAAKAAGRDCIRSGSVEPQASRA